jgi:nitronate monooxygenase
MQWVSRAELVAAVADAGAIGFMTALSHATPELLTAEIARIRELTDKPFGVNLTILPTLKPVPYDEYARAIAEAGVKFVETAGRNPEPHLPVFKAAGIKVIHKCTSVRHAIKAEAIGCDAITIDGFECAGHPGEDDVPGLILIPSAVKALKVPVVACGGFGTGRQLAAALALGAEGIAMGTRFMATAEAPVHDNVKRAMVEGSSQKTALIFRSLRNTARVYKNSIVEQVLEIEAAGGGIGQLAPLVSGQRGKLLLENGDMESGVWTAGSIMDHIDDIPSVGELVARIVAEAETVVKQLVSRIG